MSVDMGLIVRSQNVGDRSYFFKYFKFLLTVGSIFLFSSKEFQY